LTGYTGDVSTLRQGCDEAWQKTFECGGCRRRPVIVLPGLLREVESFRAFPLLEFCRRAESRQFKLAKPADIARNRFFLSVRLPVKPDRFCASMAGNFFFNSPLDLKMERGF